MISYHKDIEQKKTYKLDRSDKEDKALLYWVQVRIQPNGGFIHARGCDVISGRDRAQTLMEATALPTTEEDYIGALKDYFAADKRVREQFIDHYKLK